LSTYIHPTAEVHETARLDDDVHVWGGACVMSGAKLGMHVSVGRGAEIGRGCTIGEGTRIGYGVFIPNLTVIGRQVFIGPNATLCDDKRPRVSNPDYRPQPPVLEDNCSIGAGAVILPDVRIGRGSMVGAGAVVTCDVQPWTTVAGNPAKITRRRVLVAARL